MYCCNYIFLFPENKLKKFNSNLHYYLFFKYFAFFNFIKIILQFVFFLIFLILIFVFFFNFFTFFFKIYINFNLNQFRHSRLIQTQIIFRNMNLHKPMIKILKKINHKNNNSSILTYNIIFIKF